MKTATMVSVLSGVAMLLATAAVPVRSARADEGAAPAPAATAGSGATQGQQEAVPFEAQAPHPTAALASTVRPARPGSRTHDGFFLRMSAGCGWGGQGVSGSMSLPDGSGRVGGLGGNGSIAGGALQMGGAVARDTILHAHLWGHTAWPNEQVNGVYRALFLGGMGIGVTRYFMPMNLFVTAAVGPATGVMALVDSRSGGRHRDRSHSTELLAGFGATVSVGNEWWVSDNWAIGVALQLDYAHVRSEDLAVNHGGGKVLFTATFD